jgi:CRISPR-associated helicase Cas3/CRISPR-associated endonuclease Cas3-HD
MPINILKLKQPSFKDTLVSYTLCIAKLCENSTLIGMSVEEHCKTVAYVCEQFLKMIPKSVACHIPKGIIALAALHDIGKVSPGFLRKLLLKLKTGLIADYLKLKNDTSEYCEYHQTVSEASFRALFPGKDIEAKIIGSHHGFRDEDPLMSSSGKDTYIAYGGVSWSKERAALAKALIKIFGSPLINVSGVWADVCAGLLSLCDWIASNEKYFSQKGGLTDTEIKSRARTIIKNLGWIDSKIIPGQAFSDLFNEGSTPFKPNNLQKLISKVYSGPGVYLIEDATGNGKTEAGLDLCYKLLIDNYHNGMYFALPTRITSNKIHERVLKWMENAYTKGMAPRLIHGHSFLMNLDSGSFATGDGWFNSNRRGLILPFGVGTIDQLLMSILTTRYNFIRTFGLVNKVVILDEVHCYDVYTGKLLDLLIKRLRELDCTVIMLSATLTHKRKEELFGHSLRKISTYPLISVQDAKGKMKYKSAKKSSTKIVRVRKMHQISTAMQEAIKRANAGQQVLWVCNLVDKAVAIYNQLKDLVPESAVLHSRFIPSLRGPLEEKWLTRLGKKGDRSKGCILVTTQVCEQSVDIDADFLITDIAPSDMLLQRIGRLFRFFFLNRKFEPEVWIMTPDLQNITSAKDLRKAFGNTALLYSPFVLYRTYRQWLRRGTIVVPDDIRDILESTYRDSISQDPAWIKDLWIELQDNRYAYKMFAEACTGSYVQVDEDLDLHVIDPGDDEKDLPAQTRIGRVPYVPLILFKKYKETPDTIEATFIDKLHTTLSYSPKQATTEQWKEAIKALHQHLVMVPKCKVLQDRKAPDCGAPLLGEIMSNLTLPVTVDSNNIVRLNNIPTVYKATKESGVHKEVDFSCLTW